MLTLRSLVFADLVHEVSPNAVRKFLGAERHVAAGPAVFDARLGGFESLRRPGVEPPPALVAATRETFEGIAKGMADGPRRRLERLVQVLANGFTEVGRLLTASAEAQAMLAYGLYQNAEDDHVANLSGMHAAAPALEHYIEAYGDLVDFLLREKWFEGCSLLDFLTGYWGGSFGFDKVAVEVRPLGFPDGYYQAASCEGLNLLCDVPDVLNGGRRNRLSSLPARCDFRVGSWQVVSWDRLEGLPLFRQVPSIAIDAGLPILGLAEILIHEFTHHVFHVLGEAEFALQEDLVVWVNRPVLNEGFAEYHAAQAFAPVTARFPSLDGYRRLRHVALHANDPEDAHVAGAALFAAAAAGGADPRRPADVALSPAVAGTRLENRYATPELKLFHTSGSAQELKIASVAIPDRDILDAVGAMIQGAASAKSAYGTAAPGFGRGPSRCGRIV